MVIPRRERSQGSKSLATFATFATKIFAPRANHLIDATSLTVDESNLESGDDPVCETTRDEPATATRFRAVQSRR